MTLRRWFEEVWNEGNLAAIDELTWPDVVMHNLLAGDGETTYDLPSFKEIFQPVLEALSDVHVSVEDSLSDGNLRAVRCVITAVHHGDVYGALARSRQIRFTGMAMARLRDGLIEESWNYFDFETMYQQME